VRKVVFTTMILHNLCVRGLDEAPPATWAATNLGTRHQEHSAFIADIKRVYGMTLQSEIAEDSDLWKREKLCRRRVTAGVSKMRDALAEQLEQAGMRRPTASQLRLQAVRAAAASGN